jgi:hypothetical protein
MQARPRDGGVTALIGVRVWTDDLLLSFRSLTVAAQ